MSAGSRARSPRLLTVALFGVLLAANVAPPAAGADSASAHFAVVGDWGYGSEGQARVAARMCERHARSPFSFILTTGDNFYRPNGEATDENFRAPAACLISSAIPWRAAWGNHDVPGTATSAVLGAPGRWYRFRAGPALVVVLDANRPTDPGQLTFMRRAIPVAWPGPVILAFHQPLRSGGLHRPSREQRAAWEPILNARGVDLVLQGHNHAYERLLVAGRRYLTTGGGGAPLYPCVVPVRGLERCTPVFHFLDVVATRTTITVRAIGADGTQIDRLRVDVPR